eukprot:GHVL01036352.1.p1 GENE.GHVL01036352.1~~GHVL01036352.1.p1  ORF type:complete len:356 (+),score=94.34 GHVL01036352.1:106-1173(+)
MDDWLISYCETAGESIKGTKPVNQDCYSCSFFSANERHFWVAGVFDGHGPNGEQSSNMASSVLLNKIQKKIQTSDSRPMKILLDSFRESQKKIIQANEANVRDNGTTAVITIIEINADSFCVGNCGDSSVFLISDNSSRIQLITTPHTLDNKDEINRINDEGRGELILRQNKKRLIPKGMTINEALMEGVCLGMGRALGHWKLSKYGVSNEPDIFFINQKIGQNRRIHKSWHIIGPINETDDENEEEPSVKRQKRESDEISEKSVKSVKSLETDMKPSVKPSVKPSKIVWILLATDGITDVLHQEEIRMLFENESNPRTVAERILSSVSHLTRENVYRDDATALILKIYLKQVVN